MFRTNFAGSHLFLSVVVLYVTAAGSVPNHSEMLDDTSFFSISKSSEEQQIDSLSENQNEFPFKIKGSSFVRKIDEKPIFLNIIGYQPLEPGKKPWDENYPEREQISDYRLKDDLRRFRAFQGGSEPVVLRIYTQPTPRIPTRFPKFFYDGIRELGFWIIRDIYFDNIDVNEGKEKVDMIFSEVNDANAFDLIFAWEIGNEFKAGKEGSAEAIESFIEDICTYIKTKVNETCKENVSDWVTWQSWVGSDPLWTDYEYTIPIEPEGLDYISFNAYCYEPDQIRDHQAGPTTGTPYQGYLAALKNHYSDQPLLIVETGLSDSTLPEPDSRRVHKRLQPWYPSYRKGALTGEQAGEGLADRYWDTRLLSDDNDVNMVIAGITIFIWSDEWWKAGGDWEPDVDNQMPEEHFGLGRFINRPNQEDYQLRHKLQKEVIQYLYTLNFDNDVNIIEEVTAEVNSLSADANTLIHVSFSEGVSALKGFRWEASRGFIFGDSNSSTFYAGNAALSPAKITFVAIDANGNVDMVSTSIDIETSGPNRIELLTAGSKLSSGRVHNVDLGEYKLICYLLEKWRDPNELVVKPRYEMKSIWIRQDGYWWLPIVRNPEDDLYCWLVPKEYEPNEFEEQGWSPSCAITEANTVSMDPNIYTDNDNDLLPDYWEMAYFSNIESNDQYSDNDGDMANNLEEFLKYMNPNDANDDDEDGLWDNWEYHFFGDINFFDANNDPDCDGLKNWQEHDPNVGTHPARASQDKDQDRLPDLWEYHWFGNIVQQDANDNPDNDCLDNIDEYELGSDPTTNMGDFNCDWVVDLYDLAQFDKEWLRSRLSANVASEPRDRMVNFLDWVVFANAWQSTLSAENYDPNCDIAPDEGDSKVDWQDAAVFAEQWLHYDADIAPSNGDGVVNFLDFAVLADNWLVEL